jgi:YHS domain-containing protein
MAKKITNLDKAPVTVCGGKIEDSERFPSAVFEGERHFFCTEACLRAFESDPERFMSGEIEHPLDEEYSSFIRIDNDFKIL